MRNRKIKIKLKKWISSHYTCTNNHSRLVAWRAAAKLFCFCLSWAFFTIMFHMSLSRPSCLLSQFCTMWSLVTALPIASKFSMQSSSWNYLFFLLQWHSHLHFPHKNCLLVLLLFVNLLMFYSLWRANKFYSFLQAFDYGRQDNLLFISFWIISVKIPTICLWFPYIADHFKNGSGFGDSIKIGV